MRLDGLLAEEETDSDLAVDQAIRDQLQHFDLAHRGLLLEFAEWPAERNDLGVSVLPLGRDGFEAALVVHVAAEDLLALCGVHAWAIGRMAKPL